VVEGLGLVRILALTVIPTCPTDLLVEFNAPGVRITV